MSRIHQIQALRGVAATMVVIDHALGPVVKHGVLPESANIIRFDIGTIGVSVFFVISGFIMVHTSYDTFGSARSSYSFAVKRIIRIVPIYWISTFIAFVLFLIVGKHQNLDHLFKSLFFIPYYDSASRMMQPTLGPGWTLNYEMLFYVIFSISLLFPTRAGVMFTIVVLILDVIGGSFLRPLNGISPPSTVWTFWSHPIVLLFAAGIVIGVLEKNDYCKMRLHHSLWIACAVIVGQIIFCIVFSIGDDVPFPLVIVYWAPAIVAVGICVFCSDGAGDRFALISERIGDASYSTYLFHVLFLGILDRILIPYSAIPSVLYVLVAIVGANVIGMAINAKVERPLTSQLRKWFLRNSVRGV